ncbi:formylglycine-generating enzyme family protein [Phormidesmis sp. 146-12]
MPRCPVCQTKVDGQTALFELPARGRCPSCDWELQALPFLIGLVPEVVQKEATRLEWAKQLWKSAKLHVLQLQQIQRQLQESHDRAKHLQAQLDQALYENTTWAETLRERETIVVYLQDQFAQLQSKQDQFIQTLNTPPLLTSHPSSLLPPPSSLLTDPIAETISLDTIALPGGSFWMGSPDTEAERDRNESPHHKVIVAPCAMGKFPVTQAQWRVVAALPKINRSLSLCPSNFEGDDRPVEQVAWYDAIEFCDRLSAHTGHLYRLPSEAEWEYACRAGTTTPFYFGDTISPDQANFDGNYTYGNGLSGTYRQETTAIGTLQTPNAFGLYDLHGNVWEWCADHWHENYEGAPLNGQPWEDEDGGTYRILRGGAWYCLPGLCRSAQRHWNQPDTGGSGIGFRVARSLQVNREGSLQ